MGGKKNLQIIGSSYVFFLLLFLVIPVILLIICMPKISFGQTHGNRKVLNFFHTLAVFASIITLALSLINLFFGVNCIMRYEYGLQLDWNERDKLKTWWNDFQQENRCCGLRNGLDWIAPMTTPYAVNTSALPTSCCIVLEKNMCFPKHMFPVSCLTHVCILCLSQLIIVLIQFVLTFTLINMSFKYVYDYVQHLRNENRSPIPNLETDC